ERPASDRRGEHAGSSDATRGERAALPAPRIATGLWRDPHRPFLRRLPPVPSGTREVDTRRRRCGIAETAKADPVGRAGPRGFGPPQLKMLPGRQADPVGNVHHRGDAAQPKSVKSERGGGLVVPDLAAVDDANLHIRA
ncbi:hypothetical protein BFJ67_g18156, partial [Fusarium oxysporum f. sp. cepae]